MNTFKSQGFQTPYDDDVDDDPVALLHGVEGRMGTVIGFAGFR
mgnify:FL=1